jgi:hypothetical protein
MDHNKHQRQWPEVEVGLMNEEEDPTKETSEDLIPTWTVPPVMPASPEERPTGPTPKQHGCEMNSHQFTALG